MMARKSKSENVENVEIVENGASRQMSFEGMVEDANAPDPGHAIETVDDSPAPLAVFHDEPQFNAEDIAPPIVKLLQALSPEVVEGSAKAGKWLLSGFEAKDSVNVVPISFARRREYRDPDTMRISCSSPDGGVTGEGDPGGVCADCPMNKWTGEGRNRKAPECVFMYSYIVYVQEYNTLAVVNFKKTGLAIGRSMNSIVARAGMGNVVLQLSSKIQQGGRGTYYIPQIRPVTGEEANSALDGAAAMLGG